jgi:TolB protein
MTKRVLTWIAVLLGLGVSVALAAKPARRAKGAPSSNPVRRAFQAAGRVAYIGDDANVYVCEGSCDRPTCLTCPPKAEHAAADGLMRVALTPVAAPGAVQYNWPSFSPDASQVAYSSMQRASDPPTYGIHAYDLKRRAAVTIFQSPDQPIYLSWLPDGKQLFFLVSDGDTLKLMLAEAREARPVRIILSGQPLYYDWNQAAGELAFHYLPAAGAAEQTGLMTITGRDQRVAKTLAGGAAPFKNPAWSPDKSRLAYVVDRKNGQMALVVAKGDGSAPNEMVGLEPRTTSFVWSPDSKLIAFSTVRSGGGMSYDGVNLLDVAGGNISTLVSEPVIAYYFSPDGRRLAYIGATETSNTWNVIEVGGKTPRRLCNFVATRTESVSYRVFDQYSLSHRVWSPDSRALVFAGVMLKEGMPLPAGVSPPSSVWMLPVDGTPAQALADGDVAFWSPVP